jgi:EAL domain-containing protein (putative c-di-GMP-specific phosphodiesterase class I)
VRELGCRKIQGFYFGRPMPGEEASGLFRQWAMLRKDSAA